MINQENINKIYEWLIEGKELTTKELKSFGFNSKDLAKLIDQGVLTRLERGLYGFCDIEGFYNYGKKLRQRKEYTKAIACFEFCYELDPENPPLCFELFLNSIRVKDFSKAFEYFKYLFHYENDSYHQKDNNLFLFLFNELLDLPEEYKKIAREIDFQDVKASSNDKRYVDLYMQNKIRKSIINKRFGLANQQLAESAEKIKTNQEFIIKNFLVAIRAQKYERLIEIKELISSGDYESLKIFFEHLLEKDKIGSLYEFDLMITNDLIRIKETGEIPKVRAYGAQSVFDAIKYKNYGLALELQKEYIKDKPWATHDDLMLLLLETICKEIKEALYEPNLTTQYKKEIDFINSKMASLKERGIVILDDIDNAQIKNYKNAVNEMPNVSFIDMKIDNKLVLVYSEPKDNNIDMHALFNEFEKAYYNQDYKTCIEKGRKRLKYKKNFRGYDFYLLGTAYYRIKEYELAIDYLTVANLFEKKKKSGRDYSNLIETIKIKAQEKEARRSNKKYFEMSEDSFMEDATPMNNVSNVEQVVNLIASGIDVMDACSQVGLSDDEKNLVYLTVAKEYYYQGFYKEGDKYLKLVEKNKGKSKVVKKLFEEITKNKKFYINRADKAELRLNLVKKSNS